MKSYLHNILETDAALWILVALAFLLRIVGIGYGLPLTLVGDEPPFTLAALQMLNLHTLIPAFHLEAFKSILYYPPYLSYFYLAPFIAITAIYYFLWHGSSALFSAHLMSDLSAFFITARFVNILLGTFSVYLVYRIAQTFFASRIAAVVAGFLIATSLIHESLSMVGRHWLPMSFIFVLVLYVLTRTHLPEYRRIWYVFLIAGIGMGVSTFALITLVLLSLWFFIVGTTPLITALRDKRIWSGVLLFLILAPIPSLLYPYSQGFLGGVLMLHGQTTLLGFVTSPFTALLLYARSEPVLISLFLVGVGALWLHKRRWSIFFIAFFLFYVLLFYSVAAFEYRFFLPLVPLYALIGGYAGYLMTKTRLTTAILFLLLLIPLAETVRLSTLAYQGDTRAFARSWALEHLKPSDKVLVYGELMRLPVNKESVVELRTIDQGAVRRTDEAGALLNRAGIPHALNLSTVTSENFMHDIATYARNHTYDYLIYDPAYAIDPKTIAAFNDLVANAQLVREWNGFDHSFSVAGSMFTAPLPLLFSHASLGPTMRIYKLQ